MKYLINGIFGTIFFLIVLLFGGATIKLVVDFELGAAFFCMLMGIGLGFPLWKVWNSALAATEGTSTVSVASHRPVPVGSRTSKPSKPAQRVKPAQPNWDQEAAKLCQIGEMADNKLLMVNPTAAKSQYQQINQDMRDKKHVDSYVVAKTALSLLYANILMQNFQEAHRIWTDDDEFAHLGIAFIEENQQISEHDFVLYFELCGLLNALSADPDEAVVAQNVAFYYEKVCGYCSESNRQHLPQAVYNWTWMMKKVFENKSFIETAVESLRDWQKRVPEYQQITKLHFLQPDSWIIAGVCEKQTSISSAQCSSGLIRLYETGEQIDKNALMKNTIAAKKAYEDMIQEIERQKIDEPYLLARVTLSLLYCHYLMKDYQQAWKIVTGAHEIQLCKVGLAFIGVCELSSRDTSVFYEVKAALIAGQIADKHKAAKEICEIYDETLRVCAVNDPPHLKNAVSNWHRRLRDVFKGSSIPEEYMRLIKTWKQRIPGFVETPTDLFLPLDAWQPVR